MSTFPILLFEHYLQILLYIITQLMQEEYDLFILVL